MVRGHGEKLSRKQEVAIAALLSEPSVPAAARVAGVSENGLRAWLKQEGFLAEFRAAQQQVRDGVVAGLIGASVSAIETLKKHLGNENGAVAVRAALGILDQSHKFEAADRDEELKELRQMLEAFEAELEAVRSDPCNRGL